MGRWTIKEFKSNFKEIHFFESPYQNPPIHLNPPIIHKYVLICPFNPFITYY